MPDCRSPRPPTESLLFKRRSQNIPLLHIPSYPYIISANCASIQGCRKGDAVAQEPAARYQARTCQALLAASDTCGLLPGPDTGAAPVHEQTGGPAQILRCTCGPRYVYLL